MVTALLFVGLALVLVALFLASLSRHKKSATGALKIIGATGLADSVLDPEGSVVINGELWRARIENGRALQPRDRVQVVGVLGHLILVEPRSDKL